ncbi:hypothetical protein HYU09_00700 [Candidatus Woesearchaeota archaeon]|nr:hypothetical protein [Candidatus Woesearchaeota archaeon]
MERESFDIKISSESVKKAKSIFLRYWPYLLTIIPILITIIVRSQSIDLTITDDLAKDSVYNFYRDSISSQLRQQYRNLPNENIQGLIDEQFREFLKGNKEQVERQIKEASGNMRSFYQYESGSKSYPYMGDIDSYYWLRQARNIVEKGHNCDVVENGLCYDTYTLAPNKAILPKSLHPYSIVFLYKIVKPFNPDFTLMQAQLIVPAIVSIMTAIIVFIMLLRMRGLLAAITGSVLISVSPIFLSRSLGSDSDVYNIFFPVLIVFLAYLAFNSSSLKNKLIFSAGAGLAIGAYSFAWVGWWYLFDFIVIAILVDYFIILARNIGKSRRFDTAEIFRGEKAREFAATLASFLIFSFISLGMVSGFAAIKAVYESPLGFLSVKAAAGSSLWPNVLTTVAEFNEASISEIIGNMWGKWFFFFALFGFLVFVYGDFKNIRKNWAIFLLSTGVLYYLATPSGTALNLAAYMILLAAVFLLGLYAAYRSDEHYDAKMAVLLFIWTAASVYAATKGVRFVLLLVPPVCIGIGIAFGFLHKTATGIAAKLTRTNKAIVSVIIFLIFVYFLFAPVKTGLDTAKNYLPSVNDQWWQSLTKIKEQSGDDAIINSWWDFGHWFKYIADRRVTLDGSSQNNPQLHWLGKLLLTPDEKQAVGILRMLDCGGNNAFSSINKKKNDTPKSIGILNRIILEKDRNEAKKTLIQDGFSEKESEDVLKYTHCMPPENFLIVSEDMVGKSGVWAHFGSWDFDRAWMQKTFSQKKEKMEAIKEFEKQLNISKEAAEQYYSEISSLNSQSQINAWIAPWPNYIQGESGCDVSEELVVCTVQNIKVFVNLSGMDAFIPTSQGIKRLNSFVYTTPNGLESKTYPEDNIGLSMVLMANNDGTYQSIFMHPQLVNSTFTKLFYLNGHGTSYFEPFHESGGGLRIKIWKVDWDGMDKPLIADRFKSGKIVS